MTEWEIFKYIIQGEHEEHLIRVWKHEVKRGHHKIVSKEKVEHIYKYIVTYKWQVTWTSSFLKVDNQQRVRIYNFKYTYFTIAGK